MARALSDVKIVELGELVAAPYASKLMADMGAEVIKIERPGVGDRARTRGPFPKDEPHPEKSGLFLYLNTNKLGVTLDIATAEGFEIFEKLIAGADILDPQCDSARDGSRRAHLRSAEENQPEADHDLDHAMGTRRAISQLARRGSHDMGCGRRVRAQWRRPRSSDLPPLKTFGSQSGFQGGIHSAVATMGALFARLRDGEGQHIDAPMQEAIAAQLEMTFEYWPYMKMIATRLGQKPLQPVEIFQARTATSISAASRSISGRTSSM